MPLLTTLKSRVRQYRSTYVCRFCSLTFERELSNCPACGCSDVE